MMTLRGNSLVALNLLLTVSLGLAEEPEERPALEGICPVSYFKKETLVKGEADYKVKYAGKLYYLSGPDSKKLFEEDAEKYLPQFDSLCTMALGGPYGNRIPGSPQVFEIVEGRLYFFSSHRAKRAYLENPQSTMETAKALFHRPQFGGHCPVTYFVDSKAEKGNEEHKSAYRSYTYHLASAEKKKKFQENPETYLPQFDGFCLTGIFQNKKFPSDGKQFAIVDGKLYLFFNEPAKQQFLTNQTETIQRANGNWTILKHLVNRPDENLLNPAP